MGHLKTKLYIQMDMLEEDRKKELSKLTDEVIDLIASKCKDITERAFVIHTLKKSFWETVNG